MLKVVCFIKGIYRSLMTFNIVSGHDYQEIYDDYLKADEDKRGYIKYNSTYYFTAELRITLIQLNQLYSWETFNQSEVK